MIKYHREEDVEDDWEAKEEGVEEWETKEGEGEWEVEQEEEGGVQEQLEGGKDAIIVQDYVGQIMWLLLVQVKIPSAQIGPLTYVDSNFFFRLEKTKLYKYTSYF